MLQDSNDSNDSPMNASVGRCWQHQLMAVAILCDNSGSNPSAFTYTSSYIEQGLNARYRFSYRMRDFHIIQQDFKRDHYQVFVSYQQTLQNDISANISYVVLNIQDINKEYYDQGPPFSFHKENLRCSLKHFLKKCSIARYDY